ncbi:MAG: hypothetical protein IJ124_06365 [Clostridia bacterium]|nr:hypothetical protein [Clostridia bacterium]MBQ9039627.1 hypothetical protein [Clostridia bacterium]MBQ9250853.1 hypothetical protein [Oscillospiraceae bacterium]
MTVRAICEMAERSLNTLADMMANKAREIFRTDSETARELTITATALRHMAKQIPTIGGGRQ